MEYYDLPIELRIKILEYSYVPLTPMIASRDPNAIYPDYVWYSNRRRPRWLIDLV